MIGIYLLTIITETLKLVLLFHGLLGFSYRKGYYKYALILFASVAFCMLYFIPKFDTLLLSIIIIVINLFSTQFLFYERIKILLKTYVCVSVVTVTWDNLLIQAINLLYDFDETVAASALLQQLICNAILILLIVAIWFITKRRGLLHKLNYSQLSNTVFFLFLSIAALSAYINSLAYIIYEKSNIAKPGITYIAMIILSVLFQVICITLIILFYSREQYKRLDRLREEYNEKQIDYYKTLLSQEEDTRKFRHDIRNHIICIEELLDTGKLEDAKSYIQDIHHNLGKITSVYDTGNDIINAIINYYANKGKEDHITIQVKGRITHEYNIPMMHLSTVVSNLMSNAYEAAIKVNSDLDRLIIVEIYSGSKYLELVVKNPAVTDRAKLDGRTFTTKSDKRNHGFGIQNIKEVIAKYDGELHLKDELDSVTVRVIMKTS
jgi:signal transduction histidine kinase